MIKLNLASGKDYREGYINIDNGSMWAGAIDIKKNVFSLKWHENSVDEILLCHFMMYVDIVQAPILFKKFFDWLKPGGVLIIETGDLKKIAKTIFESNDNSVINGTNGAMQLFGWAETKGHTWAWCKDTIKEPLIKAGFVIEGFKDGGYHNRPERDFIVFAKKP